MKNHTMVHLKIAYGLKTCVRVNRFAIVAQLVERVHGKDEVPGSIPGDGSKRTQTIEYGAHDSAGAANQSMLWLKSTLPSTPQFQSDAVVLHSPKHTESMCHDRSYICA